MQWPCPITCSFAVTNVTRTCTKPEPQNGGAFCSGKPSKTEVCIDNCPGKCMVKELFLYTILLHTNTCLQLYKVLVILPFFASL